MSKESNGKGGAAVAGAARGSALMGRCLCYGEPNTERKNGKWEGYPGPIRERPSNLIHRGGDGVHAEYQCPHCFGWWKPAPNAKL